jgi:hypothetical protein
LSEVLVRKDGNILSSLLSRVLNFFFLTNLGLKSVKAQKSWLQKALEWVPFHPLRDEIILRRVMATAMPVENWEEENA